MTIKENVKSNSLIHYLSSISSKQIFWIISFSVLTFFSAQITVPTQPVPFTLQTMIVILSGAFLGARNGMLSQLLYLAGGVIGLPIFAEYSFGIARLFGPTGGYLISFPIAAFLVGYIIDEKSKSWTVLFAMILGSLLILLFGSLYLSLFFDGNLKSALFSGAVIFSVWDIIKIAAAFSIYKAFSKKYPKLPVAKN